MYDMIIFEGNDNKRVKDFKVREWLNSFTGEIIDFKTNLFGDCIFIFDTVRRV